MYSSTVRTRDRRPTMLRHRMFRRALEDPKLIIFSVPSGVGNRGGKSPANVLSSP